MLSERQQGQLAKAWFNGFCAIGWLCVAGIGFRFPYMVLFLVGFVVIPAVIGLAINRVRKGVWLTW